MKPRTIKTGMGTLPQVDALTARDCKDLERLIAEALHGHDGDDAALCEADAEGYARGVEDAAKRAAALGGSYFAAEIRALLKPKGEAK